MAERFKLGLKAGDAHGRGSHIHSAALLAEIERDADEDECVS